MALESLNPRTIVSMQLNKPYTHSKLFHRGIRRNQQCTLPLQLWDKLTPQVQDTLNILCQSRINPTKSAYEVLEGLYDWNRYPLVPQGCKEIIYKTPDERASWAPRGTDTWWLWPSKDHYRCAHYYVPDTGAYRVLGSAKLFPQHCQVQLLAPYEHIWELWIELNNTMHYLPKLKHEIYYRLWQKILTCI